MSKERKVKVTQKRSVAGRDPSTRRTATALGLGRIGKSKIFSVNPALEGMLQRVGHIVEIVEVKE